jgi:mannose-6-phosphate isomerase-like protein (cupin superfamily)
MSSYRLVEPGAIQVSPTARRLDGHAFAGPVSLFILDNPPGKGPELHFHPYAETFVVESGQATFTVDGETAVAGPGDVVIVAPETPHKFVSSGSENLRMVAIHPVAEMVQTWVDEPHR